MAGKIARSGLTLGHLKAIENLDGEDGLGNTFLVKTEGRSRVSCTKETLYAVVSKLTSVLCK